MQLILSKDAINKKNNKIKNTVAIISNREWLREEISEKVRLADISDIKSFDEDIFIVSKINVSDKTIGVIIDIVNNGDVAKTLDLINKSIEHLSDFIEYSKQLNKILWK